MQLTIYFDVRCLQDYNYRVRGIGHHVTALLRARAKSQFSNARTVGLIDAHAPELPVECSCLLDEVSASLNPSASATNPSMFIDGTPMTHDTRFGLRFVGNPNFLTAAVVYDFIPLDWPGYLPSVTSRIDYFAKMARLRKFDWFLPISEYAGWRTSQLLGISPSRIRVTGASVRNRIYELRAALQPGPSSKGDYFFLVVGPDPRKNAEVAIIALRRLNLLYSRRIGLKIAGHFPANKEELLRLAGHAEGDGFLEFHPNVSDKDLVALYAGAIATIVPSHIEGFSLPVVEAAVCGSPVVASTCAAHLELIEATEALFPSRDAKALADKLETLLNEAGLRESIIASQAHLPSTFHEDSVGKRFWNALEVAQETRNPVKSASRKTKPRIAFLSPFPPDRSGVARYTALAMRGGEDLFNSDIFTDAPRPLTVEGRYRDGGKVTVAPFMGSRYNGIVSVLGNSVFHNSIFEVFDRYGGPCILHDTRLTGYYFMRLGQEGFLKFASGLLGRSVSMDEVHLWLQDEEMPSLFLERVIERASPLIVHTKTQKALLKSRYGAEAHVTTCCPTILFDKEELTFEARKLERERLGLRPDTFLISSFGIVDKVKGVDTCIVAIEFLRSWNIPAELYLVGGAQSRKGAVDKISEYYGVSEFVHCNSEYVDDSTYRRFLLASDAAVQLRTYGFGQLSAALTDCISAEIPCVANENLAESCDAPDYVKTVPDCFSPLQVAEQLAAIYETQKDRPNFSAMRMDYLETHNFEYYARRLMEILELS